LPHRMHLGGQIALVATYLLIGGLTIFPQTRPAAGIVALIPDPVIYAAGMHLAKDWGHADPQGLDAQVDQARRNLERKFCDKKDQPWWCV